MGYQSGLGVTFYMTVASMVVCAHCGGRMMPEDEDEHMCMGFVFDWLEALDGKRRSLREYGELMDLMGEMGIA